VVVDLTLSRLNSGSCAPGAAATDTALAAIRITIRYKILLRLIALPEDDVGSMDDLSWGCRAGQHVDMADGAYQINPNAVMSITADVASLAGRTSSVTSELMSMSLDATAFASIGSAVASANSALQNQILQNLTALTRLIAQTNQSVATSAQNYVAADTAVAQSFGGGHAVTPVAIDGGYSFTYPLPNTAGMSSEQVWSDVAAT